MRGMQGFTRRPHSTGHGQLRQFSLKDVSCSVQDAGDGYQPMKGDRKVVTQFVKMANVVGKYSSPEAGSKGSSKPLVKLKKKKTKLVERSGSSQAPTKTPQKPKQSKPAVPRLALSKIIKQHKNATPTRPSCHQPKTSREFGRANRKIVKPIDRCQTFRSTTDKPEWNSSVRLPVEQPVLRTLVGDRDNQCGVTTDRLPRDQQSENSVDEARINYKAPPAAKDRILSPHKLGVRYMALIWQNKIVSCSDDGVIVVADMSKLGKAGEHTEIFRGHAKSITHACTYSENLLLTASSDCTAKMWKLGCGLYATYEGHELPLTCVLANPANCEVITGSKDWTIRIWDSETALCKTKLDTFTAAVSHVTLLPELGNCILNVISAGELSIWDQSGVVKSRVEGLGTICCFDIQESKGAIFVGTKYGNIYHLRLGENLTELCAADPYIFAKYSYPVNVIRSVFDTLGSVLAGGFGTGELHVYDILTGINLYKTHAHSTWIIDLQIHIHENVKHGTRTMVVGSCAFDGTVRVANVLTDEIYFSEKVHSSTVYKLVFASQDDTLNLFSCGADARTVKNVITLAAESKTTPEIPSPDPLETDVN